MVMCSSNGETSPYNDKFRIKNQTSAIQRRQRKFNKSEFVSLVSTRICEFHLKRYKKVLVFGLVHHTIKNVSSKNNNVCSAFNKIYLGRWCTNKHKINYIT